MKTQTTIKKGSLVSFEQGEYSDYTVMGVFLALGDIQPDALVAEWLKLHPEQAARYSFRESAFLAWLSTEKRLIADLPYSTWHLGNYGAITEMLVKGPEEGAEWQHAIEEKDLPAPEPIQIPNVPAAPLPTELIKPRPTSIQLSSVDSINTTSFKVPLFIINNDSISPRLPQIFLGDLAGKSDAEVRAWIVKEMELDEVEQRVLENLEIRLAWLEDGSYESSAWFLFTTKTDAPIWFELHASHCSCYGYEDQFKPEVTTPEYLRSDKFSCSACWRGDSPVADGSIIKAWIHANVPKASIA